ncbi:MAG TPA: hypothetical protein VLV18_01715, partial [Terriglobales bacterium]|nr:hypothetical protein [Terriglobales bacterium]
DVDGVYTSDPEKDKGAKKLDQVSVQQLTGILSSTAVTAGEYDLMDPLALRIIARSRIPTIILDGRNPSNVAKALRNEKVGSKILSE